MAIIEGQIGSLRSIKSSLNRRGINRFDSIGDMIRFNENFELERQKVIFRAESALSIETENLRDESIKYHNTLENLRDSNKKKLDQKIQPVLRNQKVIKSKVCNDWFCTVYKAIELKILHYLELIFCYINAVILKNQTRKIERKVFDIDNTIHDYTVNQKAVIHRRSLPELRNLAHTKSVITELNPLIAGAFGENLVEKEIAKLSDEYYMINDFSIRFDPPIYNRQENDRILSIQIDHLLISRAGIFIIETKNWSKKSVQSLDMRSPIQQIQRSSYALFVLLNSRKNNGWLSLNWHHWGQKQFPIRNIVVMINEKPKERFKYVQIKSLNELNGYVTYFDPIFSKSEVNRIFKRLQSLQYKG